MTNFLPYAIIAGIVIVFFVICYIMYSGNGSKDSQKHEHVHPQEVRHLAEEPVPNSSRRRQQATVHHAHKERPAKQHKRAAKASHMSSSSSTENTSSQKAAPVADDDFDTTRVLSRDEILEAMEKVDKEEAEAFKKREAEAKLARQRQQEEERKAQERQLEENRKKREQALAAKNAAKAKKKAADNEVQWQEAEEDADHPLAGMAAVVSADLAAKNGDDKAAAAAAQKVAAMDKEDEQAADEAAARQKAAEEEKAKAEAAARAAEEAKKAAAAKAAAEKAAAEKAAAEKAAAQKAAAEEKQAAKTPHRNIIKEIMAQNAKAAGQAKAAEVKTAAKTAAAAGAEVTQILKPGDLKKGLVENGGVSEDMKQVAEQLGQTQRMEPIHIDTATAPKKAPEETMIMPPLHARKSQEKAKPVVHPAAAEAVTPSWGRSGDSGTDTRNPLSANDTHYASVWEDDSTVESPVVRQCVAHFLRQYGVVSPQLQQQTEYITSSAFDRIGCQTDADRQRAMAPLIVQEALQNVQKAYAAHPDDYVGSIALQAFYDIVHCSPISTRHLVAIDALKVMPYLSQGHYQILAILLLFLYSRNSHNVDKASFCQYIDKYVVPFLDGFPTERPYYQQLDYLHCTAFEAKETHFAEILADSYPLLFRYRGFTGEELRKALKGKRIPSEYIVQSVNSPLYKLAMVDESMAKRFFRKTGITDRSMQDHILRLAKKRPSTFSGEEALDIMEDISPVLADLSDIWDSSLLRVSTLSLLGLYLAQGFIKEIIGEEFDLSRWFE